MTVKALTPARMNLVVPLPHEGTEMRTTGTAAHAQVWPGAVSPLVGESLRRGDVDRTNRRSPPRATPGTRASTTATRTTTTSRTSSGRSPSADSNPYPFSELVQAYLDCRRTKRNSASALEFEAHLERNLCDLHDELIAGAYSPGRSICFIVTRPKPREVWAADFRDRIVHHLLYNRVSPVFYASFTADTCACIPGRGTLYAARRLEHQVRSCTENWSVDAHYLKCDLSNFFVSIDKLVLRGQLELRIVDPWWMRLAETILFHDPRDDFELRGRPSLIERVPPHKRLVNAPAHCGLPIGNLSSQFFANVYLDRLDQFAKHRLRARHFIRYVDDFVICDRSPARLVEALRAIDRFLPTTLGVHLNPRKTVIQPIARGIDFVGHVIKPWRRETRRRSVRVALQRVEQVPPDEVFQTANSYFGLLGQASASHNDRARLARAVLDRGHCVNAALTQTFRKGTP